MGVSGYGVFNGGVHSFEWQKQLFFYLQVLLSNTILNQQVDDKLVWKHDSKGAYSVKCFVKMAERQTSAQMESHSIFKNIWKGLAYPRAELVVWFALMERLKTKDWLHKINIIDRNNLRCVLCNNADESVDYLLVNCCFAWNVWCVCLNWNSMSWAVPKSIKDMFEAWIGVEFKGIQRK